MQEESSNEKNLGLEEEEKKESSPSRVVAQTTALEVLQDSLPSELKGKMYNDEGELWEAQQKIGLSDLQIVLNNEGYAVWREMPDRALSIMPVSMLSLQDFGSGSKSKALYFLADKKRTFLCLKAASVTRSVALISLFGVQTD
jgi:hypothetical protein